MKEIIIYTIVTPSDLSSLDITINSFNSLGLNDNISVHIYVVLNSLVADSVPWLISSSSNLTKIITLNSAGSSILPLPLAITYLKSYLKNIHFSYVFRVDPGDTLDAAFLQHLSCDDFDIAIPSYHLYNQDTNLLSILHSDNVMHTSSQHVLSEFHGAGTIFSRSTFLDTPDFPSSLTAQDGYWFWLHNLSANFIFSIDSIYNYTKCDRSLSSNTSRLLSNRLIALKSYLTNIYSLKKLLRLVYVIVIPAPDSIEALIYKNHLPSVFFSSNELDLLLPNNLITSISKIAILNSDTFDPGTSFPSYCPFKFCSFSSNSMPQIFLNSLPRSVDYYVYFNIRYPFSTYTELLVLILQQLAIQSDCSVALKKREHLSSFGYSSVSISSMRELRLSEIQSKRQSGIISVKPSSLVDSPTLLTPRVSLSIGSNEGTIRIDDCATWQALVSAFKQ